MIWRCAGILGVSPEKWTLGELLAATEARWRERWDHTAHVLWVLAEVNRDSKKRSTPYVVADFHPAADPGTRSNKKTKLTRDVFRAQATEWYRKRGLEIPAKLLAE